MATEPAKPVLQKPPGYRDPTLPVHTAKPLPVRKPVRHPPLYQTKRRRSCRRVFCCWCCALTVILIFLLFLAFLVFYFWFDPKPPVFHLQSLSFPRFNVTEKSDGNYLNVQSVARVEVRNPNGKLNFKYGKSEVEITTDDSDGTDLGSGRVDSFSQATKNVTRLKIVTKNEDVIEQEAATRLKRRFRNKDLVVKVVVRSSVGLGVGRFMIRPVGVNVICGDVSLRKLDSSMPKCTINIFKW